MKVIEFIKTHQEYFENFITRSTYHSNRIEGSTISYAETYAITFNDNSLSIKAKPREIYEAINHKYALDYMLGHVEQDISQDMIKKIGVLINKNINEIDGYRTAPVFIRGAEHIPPAPQEIPQAMMYFIYNYVNTSYSNVFEKMADTHIQFERIHPLGDGNGRTGRILLNYELLHNDMAPIVIPEEKRTDYFNMLATQDVAELKNMFEDLHQKEVELIEKFGFS